MDEFSIKEYITRGNIILNSQKYSKLKNKLVRFSNITINYQSCYLKKWKE